MLSQLEYMMCTVLGIQMYRFDDVIIEGWNVEFIDI